MIYLFAYLIFLMVCQIKICDLFTLCEVLKLLLFVEKNTLIYTCSEFDVICLKKKKCYIQLFHINLAGKEKPV